MFVPNSKQIGGFLPMIALLGLLLFSACKGPEPVGDPVPEIDLVSVSPGTVTSFTDSLVFQIAYRDGDGDLGENDPDVENLFIKDFRTNGVEGFRIRQLAPDNSDIMIAGTLNVVLPNTGITDGSTSQQVTYEVWVKDRAGNESNHETSDPITVVE